MIALNKEDFYKVTEPLKRVAINNLFARSVIEKHVAGLVYVDNLISPQSFYVIHPYGMTLLFGDSDNKEFNAGFHDYALNRNHTRNEYEWMQAFPSKWDDVLNDLFKNSLVKSSDNLEGISKNIIELNTRVNFKFNLDNYLEFKQNNINKELSIVRTNTKVFTEMSGSVVPSNFWDSAEDFSKNGIGFSLFTNNKLATTAYSAYIHDDELELGMETIPEFRGKGFAQYTCSALIDYCIENNFEPIWACRLENIGSYKLAVKLGFEPALTLPYYRLSN